MTTEGAVKTFELTTPGGKASISYLELSPYIAFSIVAEAGVLIGFDRSAQQIIAEIARRQDVSPNKRRWLKLQTAQERGGPTDTFRLGEYLYSEIELDPPGPDGEVRIDAYARRFCPEAVLTAFADLIGPNPRPWEHRG